MTPAEARAEARAEAAEARAVRPARPLPPPIPIPVRRASVEERVALRRGPASHGGDADPDPPWEADLDGRVARSWGY